jgi:PAS domain S-box-containing protein
MTGIPLNQQLPILSNNLPNLLIVDDNEENLILLEEIVSGINVNLIQALSGSDALEKTRGIDLALAILDVRMPGMNGYELALKINAERLVDKVPVIFLTAIDNDRRNELEGYGSGAVDFIYKPFMANVLQSKVQVFVDLFNQKQTIIRNAMLLQKTSDELILVNTTLQQSEANFRSFFETMTDMVVVGNLLGEIIYVNNSLCSTLGYTEADLLKMQVPELNPLEFRDEAQQIFNDIISGKDDFNPLPVVKKNGTSIPVETRAWLGKWNGKPAIFGVSKDIPLIKISEEKFSKIFYLNPSACSLTDLTTGKYVEVNEAFYSLFGFDTNEVIGKSAIDLGMLTQESLNALNLKIGISEKTAILETVLRARNGDIKDVLLSTDNMHIYDKNYRFTVIQDVTGQKIIEHTLKISEEKYRTMLNASPDGILLINLKGIITEVSEIGFELFDADNRDDLVGKDFYQFIPPDEANTIKDIFERTVNEGLVQNAELKIRKKSQSTFQSEISSTLIQALDGEPLSFMIIIRDISQRKKIETKQIHADRMANLGEMASGIAHEINQPLNIISMVMDKLLFESDKSETVDIEFLKIKSDKIFDNITRIRNIIDHVRAFSRSDDNYLLTAFDINSSIENAISMILEQYKHLDINLNTQLNQQIPLIVGNTYKFEQVIVNLLTNAKDAVLERRRKQDDYCELKVEISTWQENHSLIVEITDNGTGIDKDDIQNIMLPFYTTKDEGKGTGLGLSICYQIIKEMNGIIEIISEKANETKIRLVLDIQKN